MRDTRDDGAGTASPGEPGMVQVPLEAFFRLELTLPRLKRLPPLDGTLRGWPPEARLPDLTGLHGQEAFGTVHAGWTPEGLAFGVAANTFHPLRLDVDHPFRSDGIEVWIDTRDSREARRATRFCHHLLILPGGVGPRGRRPYLQEMNPAGAKRPEDMADLSRVRVAARIPGPAERDARGYALEFFLPREVLIGFAPHESGSIGLGYRLRSSVLGAQDLSFGERFPLWRNPSLWLSARLEGAERA